MNNNLNYWVAPANYIKSETEVINKICELFNTDITEIKGKRRQRNIVESRAILSWWYVKRKGYHLAKAGEQTNRNHATVIHHIKIVDALSNYDKEFKSKFEQIIN
jgi:chromosomal replication initiation ATPase DnaA